MPLTSAPSVNVSRSPVTRRRGGGAPASVPPPPIDTTPDAFTFTDVTGFPLSTVSVSNSIMVVGVNQPTAVSVTGGEYEKNGSGTWTAVAGTVVEGDTVKVRGTSSASNSTAVNVVLTIGGVSDTYTITTVAAAGGFTFTPLAYYDKTSVVQTAGAVSQWTDLGPNGIHLTQATGANQPAFDGAKVSFDGVNDHLISGVNDLSAKGAVCAFARITLGVPNTPYDGIFVFSGSGDDYVVPNAVVFDRNATNTVSSIRGTETSVGITQGVAARLGSVITAAGPGSVYNHDTLETQTAAFGAGAFVSSARFVLGSRLLAAGNISYFATFSIERLVLTDFVPSVGQLDEIWAWLAAGVVALWTPAALGTDVVGWWDAQDAATITQTAGAISQWADKSTATDKIGNGTQATGASQPAYGATSFNGKPGVTHAPGHWFDLPAISGRSWTAAEVFYVMKRSFDPSVGGNLGAFIALTLPGVNASADPDSAGNVKCTIFTSADKDMGNPVPLYTSPRIIGVRSAASDFQYWIDGTQFFSTTSNTFVSTTNLTYIGASNTQFALWFDGVGAEIIVVKRTLTVAERQKMEGYLAWKWGLQANLPAGHPYLAAPPTGGSAPTTNLIQDGDFDGSPSGVWVLSNAVIGGGVLTVTNGANFLEQSGVMTYGATYSFSFDYTVTSGSKLRIAQTASGGGNLWTSPVLTVPSSGTLSGTFVAPVTGFFLQAENATFTGTIDNIVVTPVFSFTPLAFYDETSVVQTAGAVSQWTDKGSNGIHLKQPTGANQPAFNAGTGWITLDGVNDYLVTDARDLSVKTALCAFMLVNISSSNAPANNVGVFVLASSGGSDWTGDGSVFWLRSAANTATMYYGGPLNLTVADNTDVRVGSVYDKAGNETLYNREASTTASANIRDVGITYPTSGILALGARWLAGVPGGFAAMKVKRLVLLDFVPTTPQRDEIWAWLAS